MTFLQHGESERLKGLWHLGGLVFAGGAAIYNLAALVQRREPHLLVNTVVYGALAAWEVEKARHHLEPR